MNMIQHIDPNTGSEFEIHLFKIDHPDDLYDRYRDEIYRAIIKSMARLQELGTPRNACFAVEAKDDEFTFELNLENIQEQVSLCISYFESIEEYEICAYVQSLKF